MLYVLLYVLVYSIVICISAFCYRNGSVVYDIPNINSISIPECIPAGMVNRYKTSKATEYCERRPGSDLAKENFIVYEVSTNEFIISV